jgi:hypothetical protein
VMAGVRLFQHVHHPTTRGGPKHVIFEYIFTTIYIFHTILGTKKPVG